MCPAQEDDGHSGEATGKWSDRPRLAHFAGEVTEAGEVTGLVSQQEVEPSQTPKQVAGPGALALHRGHLLALTTCAGAGTQHRPQHSASPQG